VSDKELDERIRTLEVRQAMIEQRQDTMGQDIKEIKNTLGWINRLVIGALIVQLLNLVMKAG
jgi:CHASE3 domain sensor protein